ncbi:hypothetical protein [Pseudoalteromonas sp. MMG024]|uniref:hypothetical protein n=1 Tax=Pseudoalteromonas sp. MMG024 TaxID=2909980 RepID=UPI001F1D58BE|nr:hypothetical protein [Pseudoalteromonas sp. MMG024]MCF6455523.1 hypothetical protein [Pseudoalteromonas sp. MMG024]
MFKKTNDILEASESELLGFSTSLSLLKPVQRVCIYPLIYLKMGFGNLTKPMAIWSMISFFLLIVLLLLSSGIEMRKEVFLFSFNLCIWVALLFVTFSTPSSYAFYGVTEKNISKIVEILDHHNVQNKEDIELLEQNIDKVDKRIEERINFYKWIIGSFWGLYILLMNFELRLISISGNVIDTDFLKDNFETCLYVILFTGFALVAMISYKRASNMLIASLQFACVEQKSRYKSPK